MGRSRTSASEAPKPPEKPQAPSDAELAAAIAAILMGAIVVASAKETIKEILLLALAGASLPLGQLEDAARVGAEFATRGEGDAGARDKQVDGGAGEGVPGGPQATGPGTRASGEGDSLSTTGSNGILGSLRGSPVARARFSNFLYRSHYALAATRRIAKDLRSGKTLGEAVLAEERNFSAHREANSQRILGTDAQVAMARAHGTTRFFWRHSKAIDYRPSHKAADGKVYDVLNPPKSTNGLPATLLHCGCHGEPAPPDAPITLL